MLAVLDQVFDKDGAEKAYGQYHELYPDHALGLLPHLAWAAGSMPCTQDMPFLFRNYAERDLAWWPAFDGANREEVRWVSERMGELYASFIRSGSLCGGTRAAAGTADARILLSRRVFGVYAMNSLRGEKSFRDIGLDVARGAAVARCRVAPAPGEAPKARVPAWRPCASGAAPQLRRRT
jgi:hypothetical protein